MQTVNVKMKKFHPDAQIPKRSKIGDAGLDMVAVSIIETDLYIEYDTGIGMELPRNQVGLIFPRSSLSNYHLLLSNHVGVVDENYRGSIKFRFKKTNTGPNATYYKIGDRIGQLIVIPYPLVLIEEVDELESSNRGMGGYGSSGV
jgi:dUTP pyrophosphatase